MSRSLGIYSPMVLSGGTPRNIGPAYEWDNLVAHAAFQGAPPSPEKNLITAMFYHAMDDLERPSDHIMRLDAEGWIAAMSKEPWGFSWACHILGLDPTAVAEKLLRKTYSHVPSTTYKRQVRTLRSNSMGGDLNARKRARYAARIRAFKRAKGL